MDVAFVCGHLVGVLGTPRIPETYVASRVEADEAADLIINERFVLEDLLHQARIANGTLIDIARSPLAFGVRAGGVKRDVSTVEALKQTLLGAESVAQPDASGGAQDGTYFVNLIRYLGIADQVKPKIKLTMGGDAAAQAVASGVAQMGRRAAAQFQYAPWCADA
jgi:molybdate transport system substrate-binding protein